MDKEKGREVLNAWEISIATRIGKASNLRLLGLLSACLFLCATPAAAQEADGAAAETGTPGNACPGAIAAPPPLITFIGRLLSLITGPADGPGSGETNAPGAVLSVIGPDWSYCQAAGVTAFGGGQPVRYEMPFQIGSNTKMMTAVVILQLQEEGQLSLDDRLADHLPDIAARLPHGEQMTLRQLANHTSGIFNYTDDAPDGTPGIMEGGTTGADTISNGYSPTELIDFAIEHGEPDFAPGEEGRWNYSNSGYVLLGMIIEQLTQQPLEAVFEKRIFVPLDMDHTFFWSDVPSASFGLPSSYWMAPFEVEATNWNMSQGWSAGAVISTAPDMARFISALLNGELFSDPSTLEDMQDAVETGNPSLPRYGIGLIEKAPGVWGHGGQTIGFASDVAYVPEMGIAIVGWGNSGNNLTYYSATALNSVLQSFSEN